jgi:hypothetical protein
MPGLSLTNRGVLQLARNMRLTVCMAVVPSVALN